MPRDFVVGVDLGQQHDYTAVAVLERTARPSGPGGDLEGHYGVAHLERFRRVAYPAVIERVAAVLRETARAGTGEDAQRYRVPPAIALVVDKTGVGAGVTDHMRLAGRDRDVGRVEAGVAVNRAEHGWTVPKIDLATGVQLLLQTGRLRFAAGLPDLDVLTRELSNFRVRIGLTGRVSFAAGEEWRTGEGHDDVLLSVALAAWYGEHRAGAPLRPASPDLRRYFTGAGDYG